jgi:hypothetical protein
MIEYHLQKAFVSIIADPVQRFAYDGGPKEIAARLEPSAEPPPVVTYFAAGDSSVTPLNVTPGEKGQCRVTVAVLPWFFPAMTGIWARHKEIELWIE